MLIHRQQLALLTAQKAAFLIILLGVQWEVLSFILDEHDLPEKQKQIRDITLKTAR